MLALAVALQLFATHPTNPALTARSGQPCDRRPCPIALPAVALARAGTSTWRLPDRAPLRADTPQKRLIEYSDGYAARLALHRIASYVTLPLFVTEFVAGQVLLSRTTAPPGWARRIHGPAAGVLGGLFIINTVTGGLNMIEAWPDPNERVRRTAHGLLMLLSDAGFVATGITAAHAGTYKPDSNQLRTAHRRDALISMGIATVGYMIMLPPFRRD